MITKRNKRLIAWTMAIGAIVVILVLGMFMYLSKNSLDRPTSQQKTTATNHSTTPVLFVHGWGAGLHSQMPLAKKAIRQGVAQKGLYVYVGPSGQVVMYGHLPRHPKKSPEILVKFPNAYMGEFKEAAALHKVLIMLKRHYHVTQYNAIGHSMGAYALTIQSERDGNSPQLPRVNKLVLIAGPYDGILNRHKWDQPTSGALSRLWDDRAGQNHLLRNGQPKIKHPEYQLLMKHRRQFPRQAHILNIYGNVENGTNSDGTVTVTSALSLGSILKDQVASYQVRGFHGRLAKHPYLESKNHRVQQTIINYLWGAK
ncbi:alpha/beta hydrolase [Lentilactobacillus raoultii]|uniref:Alpha/beta hydrolase n=1 Tax=Lentilactobacillus raoultii TaxID=1987503 RepID=A0ABW3PH57_9LACO|nr:alpha/beta hydrolase [Lentilactobacillus raoultii]